MGKNVPDRWLNYKCHGKVIKGTKILAFKVPLKYETCRTLLPSHQFTPEMLMKSFPNLKYIIDLTATTRYYKRTDFTSSGVAHVKVEVPGQQVPRRIHSLKFFDAMDTFMQAAQGDELIGVHCTHGLNRTGFMVCQYLIRQLGWDVSDAIKEFEEARGHPIEREPYLRELKLISKGDKLITRIDKNLTDCKYDGRKDEKSTKSSSHPRARKEPTNWRDHPTPLRISPPTSFDSCSGRSRTRGNSRTSRTSPYHDRTKNVNNSRDLIKPSLSTGETQQNTYKYSKTQECSWGVDKRRTEITPDQVATNIAERFRKLENTFPIIHNKYLSRRSANDFTADSYVGNSNTAHTVPISQKGKRKYHSRFD